MNLVSRLLKGIGREAEFMKAAECFCHKSRVEKRAQCLKVREYKPIQQEGVLEIGQANPSPHNETEARVEITCPKPK